MKKKPSPRKLASCIQNAAKSTGPVTEEGKKRSSLNGLRHGLTAAAVVLPSENREAFIKLFEDYISILKPANVVELEFVRTAVVCAWRRRRFWAVESALLGIQITRERKAVASKFGHVSDSVRCALAIEKMMHDSSTLMCLRRYERTIEIEENRALDQLTELQANRPPSVPPSSPSDERVELRNEANPENEHAPIQSQDTENTPATLELSDLYPMHFMDGDAVEIVLLEDVDEAQNGAGPLTATATATPPASWAE